MGPRATLLAMQMLRKHPAAAHKSSVVMDEGWILVYKGAMAMGCQTEGDQVCCELFMRGQCAWIATEASGSGSSEAVSGWLGMGKGNSLALSSSCRSERKRDKARVEIVFRAFGERRFAGDYSLSSDELRGM